MEGNAVAPPLEREGEISPSRMRKKSFIKIYFIIPMEERRNRKLNFIYLLEKLFFKHESGRGEGLMAR
jgi:hypothetical protein